MNAEQLLIRNKILRLYDAIDDAEDDLRYADHGAYGQGKERIQRLRREIELLELQMRELRQS